MCRVIFYFYFIFFSERAARWGGGGEPDFSFSSFPCSADHERDWPPCKVVFFGLATNALNVRNNRHAGTFVVNNGVLFCFWIMKILIIMAWSSAVRVSIIVLFCLPFCWCPCMAINVSVQYDGGFLPDIILLTQCYYHRGTRLNAMKRFCIFSY